MKKTLLISAFGILIISLYPSKHGVTRSGGKTDASGAPGETTCSRSGCHGAGLGGLADNAGPGVISISSSNMTGWNFNPGQTYHFNVRLTDASRSVFGVCISVMDNATNTSTGTLIVTDNHTQLGSVAFSGAARQYIMHKNGVDATEASPANFSFDWTAPIDVASATIYFAGNAANGNGFNDSQDNIYSSKQVLTRSSTTALEDAFDAGSEIALYPNPVTSVLNVAVNGLANTNSTYSIFSADGTPVLNSAPYKPGTKIAVDNWKSGKYMLQMSLNGKTVSKSFIIE